MTGCITITTKYFGTTTLPLTLLLHRFLSFVLLLTLQIVQSKEKHRHSIVVWLHCHFSSGWCCRSRRRWWRRWWFTSDPWRWAWSRFISSIQFHFNRIRFSEIRIQTMRFSDVCVIVCIVDVIWIYVDLRDIHNLVDSWRKRKLNVK